LNDALSSEYTFNIYGRHSLVKGAKAQGKAIAGVMITPTNHKDPNKDVSNISIFLTNLLEVILVSKRRSFRIA